MGGGGSGTTTQKADPWSGQQPYLSDIFSQAQNLDQTAAPQYYPGNTYAPLTPTQLGLQAEMIGYGSNGGGNAINAANNSVANTLSPGYTAATGAQMGQAQNTLSSELDPNFLNPWNSPSFQTTVNNTLASALPAATSSFINGNRSDSGLATRAATMAATDAVGNLAQKQYTTNQALQNAAASQASQNFLNQQTNQTNAASIAPVIDQTQLGNLSAALNAAGMSQTDIQNQINAQMNRFNYNQMLPWNQLQLYNQAVMGGGNLGGTTTTQTPVASNTGANVMAGVGAAASVAASIAAIM
jgi:hypothetical protein